MHLGKDLFSGAFHAYGGKKKLGRKRDKGMNFGGKSVIDSCGGCVVAVVADL